MFVYRVVKTVERVKNGGKCGFYVSDQGKRGLFHDPFSSYVLRKFHVTPIDLSDAGTGALRTMLRMLGEDKAVVVFPEGHRSPDHTMKEGMLGVAYLALKSQAPILPVGLTGTEKLPGWRLPFPLRRLRVNIGQPFSLPVIEGRLSREVMRSMVDMITPVGISTLGVLVENRPRPYFGEIRF